MSNQDLTNPADEIRKEEKYSIPSLPLPYDLALGLLKKEKLGKENYYINTRMMNLFIEFGQYKATEPAEAIESVHVNEIVK